MSETGGGPIIRTTLIPLRFASSDVSDSQTIKSMKGSKYEVVAGLTT